MSAAAIVLAAGASRRLGRPKQLLARDGEPLVRRAARLCREAGFDPVLVVLGHAAAEVEAVLHGLPVQAVANPDWAEGMAASIRTGVEALPAAAAAALLLPCDQPALDRDLLVRLLQAHRAAPTATLACAYAGGVGVPALFPRGRFPELAALRGDRGAKGLLGPAVRIPFPQGGVDLDTPEDLEDWLRR